MLEDFDESLELEPTFAFTLVGRVGLAVQLEGLANGT
jgi:hypothetical protein